MGTKPHEMALAADGQTVYVTNYGIEIKTRPRPDPVALVAIVAQAR